MKKLMKRPAGLAVFLIGCAVLAAFAQLGTRPRAGSCALDGVRVLPVYSVHVVWDDETARSFCSVRCAVTFLGRDGVAAPATIDVHDEVSAKKLAASRARYVRSRVLTVPTAGNDIHVFERWEDAQRHVENYEGEAVGNPFARWVGGG